jgi:hypothetical protein
MGIVKGLLKGAVITAASVICPPAAGALYLGNVVYKVGKAITDDDNTHTAKHVVSILGSLASGVVDIDIDIDSD